MFQKKHGGLINLILVICLLYPAYSVHADFAEICKGIFAALLGRQSVTTEVARPENLDAQLRTLNDVYGRANARIVDNNKFPTDRDLNDYNGLTVSRLGGLSLTEWLLSRLGPQFRWLDLGAGSSRPMRDFFNLLRRRRMTNTLQEQALVAVAHSIPTESQNIVTQIRRQLGRFFTYIETGFLEQTLRALGTPAYERLKSLNGTVTDITDIFGWFSYTSDMELYFNTVADWLAVGGRNIIVFRSGNLSFQVNGQTIEMSQWPDLIHQLSGGRLQATFSSNPNDFVYGILILEKVNSNNVAPNVTTRTVITDSSVMPPRMRLEITTAN